MNTSIYTADFVSINGLTDPGRSGKNNEDSWERFSILVPDGTEAMQHAELIVVADGIGGARGGEVASSLAVQEIGKLMQSDRSPKRSIEQRLDAAITTANQIIYQHSAKNPDLQGMGTTVLAVVITQKHRCYVAHAGDSRAYLIRGNRIHLLTQDHTRVQEMVDMGRLTLAEAKDHPNRHVVSRFVGINDTVPVDLNLLQYSERADTKYTKALYIDLKPGDLILCCSDGLNDMLEDEEILELARRHGVQNGPTELVKEANAKGGDDNITSVVASLLGAGGVAVTPPAGTGASRGLPMAAILGVVLVLLIGAGLGYMILNGSLIAGGSDVASASPTVDAAVAVALTETPNPAVTGSEGNEAPPTATTETNPNTEAPVATDDGSGMVATSTRLVPTATNTVPPTDTPRPTNTRAPATSTSQQSQPQSTSGTGGNNTPPTRAATSTVGIATGRSPVALAGPTNGESFAQGTAITFSWQSQTLGAGETYNLKIWKQSSPNTMEREAFTGGTSTSIQGLNPEVYQWSVQVVGGNGLIPGTESSVRTFSVSGGSSDPTPDTGPEPTEAPTDVPEPPTAVPTDPPLPTRDTSQDEPLSDTKQVGGRS